jgi:hypothetical protein
MLEVTKVPVQCIMFAPVRSMIYAAQSIGRTAWHVTGEKLALYWRRENCGRGGSDIACTAITVQTQFRGSQRRRPSERVFPFGSNKPGETDATRLGTFS